MPTTPPFPAPWLAVPTFVIAGHEPESPPDGGGEQVAPAPPLPAVPPTEGDPNKEGGMIWSPESPTNPQTPGSRKKSGRWIPLPSDKARKQRPLAFAPNARNVLPEAPMDLIEKNATTEDDFQKRRAELVKRIAMTDAEFIDDLFSMANIEGVDKGAVRQMVSLSRNVIASDEEASATMACAAQVRGRVKQFESAIERHDQETRRLNDVMERARRTDRNAVIECEEVFGAPRNGTAIFNDGTMVRVRDEDFNQPMLGRFTWPTKSFHVLSKTMEPIVVDVGHAGLARLFENASFQLSAEMAKLVFFVFVYRILCGGTLTKTLHDAFLLFVPGAVIFSLILPGFHRYMVLRNLSPMGEDVRAVLELLEQHEKRTKNATAPGAKDGGDAEGH